MHPLIADDIARQQHREHLVDAAPPRRPVELAGRRSRSGEPGTEHEAA